MTAILTDSGPIDVSQKPPEWYDMIYATTSMYQGPVQESKLHPVYLKMCSKLSPNEKVIDLGCGTGQLAQTMLEMGKNFVLGIDFSPVAIDYAKQLLSKQDFVIADLYDPNTYYNLPDYDCVVMSEVMEHLENDLKVLELIIPETHLIFTVPSYITDSHLRAFRSVDHIHERYDKYMEINSMDEFMLDDVNKWKVWIVDGVNK